jgi:acyl-CoA thioesterase-1
MATRGRSRSSSRKKRRNKSGGKLWAIIGLSLATVAVIGTVAALAGVSAARDAAVQESLDSYVPTGIPTEEPQKVAPTVLFIGDSYSAGTGASTLDTRWTTLVSKELGWLEQNQALGGTGYIMTNGKIACGSDYCPNYPEKIALVEGVTPDMVVISGGRNDGRTPAGYTETVTATIESAQTRWPDATMVVTSPLWDDDPAPSWMAGSIAAVRDAATATGASFVDLGQPIEGHPDYVIYDSVHPDDEGYRAIADAFLAAWPSTPAGAAL